MTNKHSISKMGIPVIGSWDVIVVGGGPAGCTAAASAAREGAKTLLIEATGSLGGMGTSGLIPAWCPFSDQQKIVYKGMGDADLAAWAGADFEKGNEKGELQPVTLCFILSNVDEYAYRHGPNLHPGNKNSPVYAISASGKYPHIKDTHLCSNIVGPGTVGFNAGHLWDVDNTDPKSVSNAMIEGRKLAMEFRDALAEHHPKAFANAHLVATAPLIGARETRRITGDYVLTVDDYEARRTFPDEVCRNSYYMDNICQSNSINENVHIKKRAAFRGGSPCHADFAQLADWFWYGLGGLRPDESHPGLKHFTLAPQIPGKMAWAKIAHESPYGKIVSSWKRDGDQIRWEVTVPPNSTATALIPATDVATIRESGKTVAQSGLTATEGPCETTSVELPPGMRQEGNSLAHSGRPLSVARCGWRCGSSVAQIFVARPFPIMRSCERFASRDVDGR